MVFLIVILINIFNFPNHKIVFLFNVSLWVSVSQKKRELPTEIVLLVDVPINYGYPSLKKN
jgi:hypothetical protein